MIKLSRELNKKWIFQKNISSKELIHSYLDVINANRTICGEAVKDALKLKKAYRGRSDQGSINTMGVRFSQMCFYMFGYKSKGSLFIPTQTTLNILDNNNDIGKNMLVNLFSIQYPHPYSRTDSDIKIYAGRLILKLLTDERIQNKIFIDEMIWFLPFMNSVSLDKYEELVESINQYRTFSYDKKMALFCSIENYEQIFSNCLHEVNYYFVNIFNSFKVFEKIPDASHNDGKLLKFKHGNTSTYRSDSIEARGNCSGFIKLSDYLLEPAKDLLEIFPFYDKPTALDDELVYSKEKWISDLYENELIKYLSIVFPSYRKQSEIVNSIYNMTHMSKYSAVDGKDFEISLKPVFELFREVLNVETIGGPGDTDLLCAIEDIKGSSIFKINVDGKSRKSGSSLNASRLERHINIHASRYCIVVAPRFTKGAKLDILGHPIVTIEADALARYCSKECLSSPDLNASFLEIDEIIMNNLGKDITNYVNLLTEQKYGILINY